MKRTLYETKPHTYFDQIRTDIVDMIVFNASSILDIGCGTGLTSLKIKETVGAKKVVGIESSESAAGTAEQILDTVIKDSVENLHQEKFHKGEFDLIICADVLEHLVNPWNTLLNIRHWIHDDGNLIVSVPHMGHITVLLKLLMDRLEYEEEGILDRTHLKFFTLHTIRKMLEVSGFQITRVEANRSRTLKFKILDLLTKPFGSRLSIYQYRIIAKPCA